MNQVEQTYSNLIEHGYGQYSRDIALNMLLMINEITKARDEFKPEDTKFVIVVKPNTKVTVIIESP